MKIIGIDPGTVHAGYGVVESRDGELRRVDGGCVRAPASGGLPERLVAVYRGLREVIVRHGPSEAAIETVFAGDNIRTAIAIGEARGVAVLAAAEAGLAVVGYEPATVKRSVAGAGRAGKAQMMEMVRVLLRLDAPPETDHEADALALAITHARRRSAAAQDAVPAAARAAAGTAMSNKSALPDFVLAQLPPGARPSRRRRR